MFRKLIYRIVYYALYFWRSYPLCEDTTTTGLTKTLREKIFCRFAWREIVITENGSQFTSGSFRKFLKEHYVKHQFTPPYSPQCNSTDRINRVIKTCIKQFLGNDQRHWDESIQLQFAINNACQESTGYSAAMSAEEIIELQQRLSRNVESVVVTL